MVEENELDSTCGISDEELTERFKESIRIDQEICKIKGLPIACYDDENKRAPMYWTKDSNKEGMCDGPVDMEDFEMSEVTI